MLLVQLQLIIELTWQAQARTIVPFPRGYRGSTTHHCHSCIVRVHCIDCVLQSVSSLQRPLQCKGRMPARVVWLRKQKSYAKDVRLNCQWAVLGPNVSTSRAKFCVALPGYTRT